MEIFGIEGIGEIRAGDDLAAIIHEAASSAADT
ncbi:MAG TPA: coenzyme F420-0:L-glutamate ligase, partial [Acidimicrobiaceae bacterium]|nr:coenzyme F420-0:L-glutamate ligase [Acidimicrobiaceae bacterium]